MTLSEYERRVLLEIEAGCRAEDPELEMRLDLAAASARRARAAFLARCAIWLGSGLFLVGAGTARGTISTGAVVAAFGLIMVVAGLLAWVSNRTHPDSHDRSGRIR